jgi:hypothetical protein
MNFRIPMLSIQFNSKRSEMPHVGILLGRPTPVSYS